MGWAKGWARSCARGWPGGRIVASLGLAALLAACGFRPLYAPPSENRPAVTVPALAAIAVSPIPDRAGQLVRNNLLRRLPAPGREREVLYRLDVSLRELKDDLAFERDDAATRANLTVSARFVLWDITRTTAILKGNTRVIAAYNIIRSDYANLIAERDARARAADQISQQILARLAVYFSRFQPA